MGFRQKSRGIRFGFLEYVAVVLALLTTAAGLGWWRVSPKSMWVTAPARVDAVSLVENTRTIEASRPAMRLHFDYLVAGRVYRGEARFDRVTRMLYGTLPEEIQGLLRAKGYLSFKDLPPDIQELLRQKGVTSFDQVPTGVLDALRAQGYNSVHDFPEDVKRLVKAGEYARAAEVAGFSREAIEALMSTSNSETEHTQSPPAAEQGHSGPNSPTGRPTATASSMPVPSAASVSTGTILHVRYDPADPSQYEVVRIPYLEFLLNIGVFLGLAFITLFYCGVLYPKIKQRSVG